MQNLNSFKVTQLPHSVQYFIFPSHRHNAVNKKVSGFVTPRTVLLT